MSETENNNSNDNSGKKTLSVGKTLSIKKTTDGGNRGVRSNQVAVEVKRKRPGSDRPGGHSDQSKNVNVFRRNQSDKGRHLTGDELESRLKALQEAQKNMQQSLDEKQKRDQELSRLRQEQSKLYEQQRGQDIREENVREDKKLEEAKKEEAREEKQKSFVQKSNTDYKKTVPVIPKAPILDDFPVEKPYASTKMQKGDSKQPLKKTDFEDEESVTYRADSMKKAAPAVKKTITVMPPKKFSRQQLNRVLDDEPLDEKERSSAAMRRHRQKAQKQVVQMETVKVVREVTIPETINVGELANRMAVRSADVVKSLMKLGVFATINQSIDADTAELICTEFGHTPKRVTDDDFELDILKIDDNIEDLLPRAPVVTVMGHVDHGKTSLLDALRATDVVSGEAGGITQHIGAYQVTLSSGKKITFIDTPGHAAFSEMRSRGANVTDIVVLVVAADDGIKEQTIEAINHAKAANVPMIVAINKIDKPGANPDRVRHELMNHQILLEEFGGEVMAVEVSAKQRLNLEKLEETILLQAEVLELKANAKRYAQGVVVEARVDKGRGIVATVLVQKGTLNIGDVFVAGTEWGKVRALVNDHGVKVKDILPSQPVEVLGFDGVPVAGDEFFVVENESQAREIATRRVMKKREHMNKVSAQSSMEKLMGQIAAGEMKELPVIVKADVHGSLEAIASSLAKLKTDEVSVKLLHGGVGAINESDVTLARASSGIVIGFNVRANPQARDLARRDNIDIRYYSIIYNLIDEIKAAMAGLLSPDLNEKFLGQAEIRQVFSVPKAGKAAGCMVLEGIIKRGAKVRLLRDNVVIHEGTLKSLRRFKDEVKEVKDGFECGMAFENYQDIREKDIIECFEIESVARVL
ncbi:MAG: translation initiation factor IF-2 [Proteobacteria bacterium]|nr:translation initiation factor IF-2 [Pseudomonadota bacterium]